MNISETQLRPRYAQRALLHQKIGAGSGPIINFKKNIKKIEEPVPVRPIQAGSGSGLNRFGTGFVKLQPRTGTIPAR